MVTDPYVAAKSNLRDNVKTLIAVFGGIAGVLLAGTPFSGYGAIERFSAPWIVASVALAAALILLGWCVRRLLAILRPDLAYTSLLIDATTDPEIRAVQAEFESHKRELLPKVRANDPDSLPMDSVAQLVAAKSAAWALYQEDRTNAEHKEAYDRLADALASINYWSGFSRLHVRVSRGTNFVFGVGLAAVLAIAMFVVAVSSSKKESPPPPNVYIVMPPNPDAGPPPAPPAALPALAPVLFATGKSDLTPEAVTRIGTARNYLRNHAGVGVLIFANTDTVGGEAVNQTLAVRRAERVADLLRSEGGISPSRIFMTPLAKKDLPALTRPRTESETNRSVEMILIPMPVRGS